jgi:two-component system, OmpR family, response regulator ChvI
LAKIRLLLVDDDDDFREAATAELGYLGFEVTPIATGEAMFDCFAAGTEIDIIVLDWCLPTQVGIAHLPTLRERGIDTPVVFLTGVPTASYEHAALDGGAYDFVDKSRGLPILAKRIRRILEFAPPKEGQAQDDLVVGKLLLRPAVTRAYWDGVDVNLTVTEFNIVCLMVRKAGDYVTYRAIYDCVHHVGFIAGNGDDGYRANVRSAVKRIRNKFRAQDDQFSEIENYSAFGYRWRSASQ